MTDSARPLRETVAKLVGDGITRHVNGVTSMRHNKTAIATVARQVSEDIEAVVLAETEQLDLDLAAARSEVADRDERIAAQDRLIRMLEGQRRSDGGLIDRYRAETTRLRERVDLLEGGPTPGEPWSKFRIEGRVRCGTSGCTEQQPSGEGRPLVLVEVVEWAMAHADSHAAVTELPACCGDADGTTRYCAVCGGYWSDGEPYRQCTYTCTHGERCDIAEPRAWHQHEHSHLGVNRDHAWSTEAAEQNPHARCPYADPHNPHRWGRPAHWCDGTPTATPAVPETQETTP